jgi:hypothetical protein
VKLCSVLRGCVLFCKAVFCCEASQNRKQSHRTEHSLTEQKTALQSRAQNTNQPLQNRTHLTQHNTASQNRKQSHRTENNLYRTEHTSHNITQPQKKASQNINQREAVFSAVWLFSALWSCVLFCEASHNRKQPTEQSIATPNENSLTQQRAQAQNRAQAHRTELRLYRTEHNVIQPHKTETASQNRTQPHRTENSMRLFSVLWGCFLFCEAVFWGCVVFCEPAFCTGRLFSVL